jgi:hypothetical protein
MEMALEVTVPRALTTLVLLLFQPEILYGLLLVKVVVGEHLEPVADLDAGDIVYKDIAEVVVAMPAALVGVVAEVVAEVLPCFC